MCGICGFFRSDLSADACRQTIKAMTDTLAHRGPDDEGFHPAEGGALGHRRLSIIDLSSGHQPIYNEDGTVAVVLNGEIYNFLELRSELEGRGHRFSTNSDTEAIAHAYEEWGDDCAGRLAGMFAIALHDSRNRRLLLLRDRAGKKPLYYTGSAAPFLFGSEIKAVLAHPAFRPVLDPEALRLYLLHEYVPAPWSIFRGLRKLPPGHRLTLDLASGRMAVEEYWRPVWRADPALSFEDACEGIRQRFDRAVARRLVSDVPLGVFLSGGIDSSAVVAFMARHVEPARIRTFAIGFHEKSFDESGHARELAAHFGTDHREEMLDASTMLEIFPEIAARLDEPFADPSIIPTYLLSRFTRRHVTVALGGDAGDELFAGYDTFTADPWGRRYHAAVPDLAHRVLAGAAGLLPVSTANISFDFKVKQFLKGAPFPDELRHQAWLGSFLPAEQTGLLSPGIIGEAGPFDPWGPAREAFLGAEADDPLHRAINQYFRLYMGEGILTKVDRASMMNALEVRAPFLDQELVAFVGTIPSGWKLRDGEKKHILKRALAGLVPDRHLYRKKKGFGIPLAAWFRDGLRPLMEQTLSGPRLRQAGIFNPAAVGRLVDDHLAGRRDHRKQLFTLLMFELWRERWG